MLLLASGECNGAWITESAPLKPSSSKTAARVAAEQRWLALAKWPQDRPLTSAGAPVFLFRLAGVYGPGRSALEVSMCIHPSHARRVSAPPSTDAAQSRRQPAAVRARRQHHDLACACDGCWAYHFLLDESHLWPVVARDRRLQPRRRPAEHALGGSALRREAPQLQQRYRVRDLRYLKSASSGISIFRWICVPVTDSSRPRWASRRGYAVGANEWIT